MADGTVTRLPTAARRKVVQPPRDVRRALAEQIDQHPAEFHYPWARDMMRQREGLQGMAAEAMKDNAALLIAVNLVAHADPILRAKVFGSVCHWNSLYHTAETEKALNLVEPLMRGLPKPPGAGVIHWPVRIARAGSRSREGRGRAASPLSTVTRHVTLADFRGSSFIPAES